MTYSVQDFFREARRQRAAINQQLDAIRARRHQHADRIAAIRAQQAEVLAQLGRHILPDLGDAACERAARLAAYVIDGAAARRAVEEERAALRQQVAAIDADSRFSDRAERMRRLEAEAVSGNDHRKELTALLTRAAHPRLDRLLETGYGTDAYAVPWWRVSYYEDWKAADEILEQFPERSDQFGPLADELTRARDLEVSYRDRLTEIQQEVTQIDELERSHAAAAARLADLDRLHVEAWQQAVADHVARLDPAALADRLAGEPGAELLLKSAAGLGKKLEYLDELARAQLDPLEQQLTAEAAKLDRDLAKYARPKKAYTQFADDAFQRRFRDRRDRWDKHWRRYDRAHDCITTFDRYERASLVEDFLWWDLMTDGEIDGNFVREVHDFHQSHPDYRWHSDSRADDEAAAAAVAADQFDTSSTLGVDPS